MQEMEGPHIQYVLYMVNLHVCVCVCVQGRNMSLMHNLLKKNINTVCVDLLEMQRCSHPQNKQAEIAFYILRLPHNYHTLLIFSSSISLYYLGEVAVEADEEDEENDEADGQWRPEQPRS